MSLRGETGWQATHQKAFGKERWPELSRALKAPVSHVALVNPFRSSDAQADARQTYELKEHPTIPLVCQSADGAAAVEGAENDEGLLVPASLASGAELDMVADGSAIAPLMPCYFLDGASVIAALALQVEPGHAVLDLCSAPGGKAVVLASLLFAQKSEYSMRPAPPLMKGRLVCNEMSKPRMQRLTRVLSSFLPAELMIPGGNVFVTNADAAVGARTPPEIHRLGPFDRVLVDSPCTSDRHLAHQGKAALAHWAAGAVKANAERQLELLRCAAALVRPGGAVVYSTCALSEQENDGVVQKFMKKAGGSFEVESILSDEEGDGGQSLADLLPPGTEQTACGVLFLPDRTAFGPMYVSRIRRL